MMNVVIIQKQFLLYIYVGEVPTMANNWLQAAFKCYPLILMYSKSGKIDLYMCVYRTEMYFVLTLYNFYIASNRFLYPEYS